MASVLFEKLQLPVLKKTKTGPSTDADVLEQLAAMGHDVPQLILEHRELQKLRSTYVDVLPLRVNPRTGRIHTTFNQTGAATGRLSSSDPNLQNIPVRTPRGRRSAAASSRPPGGSSWSPTTRRSSCGCWPTSRRTLVPRGLRPG
jgi:DNA polymerase-1